MKKIMKIYCIKLIIIILLAPLLLIDNGTLHASEEKDLILVLDTSLSMVGYGGQNILAKVKKSLTRFVDDLDEDDSITFVTFDTEVKIYPTIIIDDENDKDIINKYISVVEAKGHWTYTMNMMKHVFQKAQYLENKDKDRQRLIVILTDTIDDPPPWHRKKRLNIKDVTGSYQGKDWFIYFVNLGDLKKNKKLIKIQKAVKKDVSEYTKIIDAKEAISKTKTGINKTEKGISKTEDSIKKTIEEDLKTEFDKMVIEKKDKDASFSFLNLLFYLLLALLIITIVLLVLYLYRKFSGLMVSGKLEYWDHTVIDPYFNTFDLTKQETREISVGRDSKSILRIRDINISKSFKIIAVREGGDIKSAIHEGGGYSIDFVNKEPGAFLENGDMFKVANYTFKYTTD